MSQVEVKQYGTGQIIQPKTRINKKNPVDYQFKDRVGEVLGKRPGQIDGEQFIILNCKDCTIYLMDWSNTVYVDDCVNCRIYIGPVESSVFVRTCVDCNFVIACGQLRTRECKDSKFLLYCQSQPIIESSLRMGFGCFRAAYPELAAQFQKANLDPWSNTWSDIYDFTPNFRADANHFYLLFYDTEFRDLMDPISTVYAKAGGGYEDQLENQVVPFTYEIRKRNFAQEILFLFYPEVSKNIDINALIRYFQPHIDKSPQIMRRPPAGNIEINGPNLQPVFLVKARHAQLFLDNYEIFKTQIPQIHPMGNKLLKELVVENRLQRLFSLHIRNDDQNLQLTNHFEQLLKGYLKISKLDQAGLLITNSTHIKSIGDLVFANMQDEKGDKKP